MNTKTLLTGAALMMTADARMSIGSCPTIEPVKNLDVAAYAGNWYEIERDPMFPYTMMTECTYKKFTVDDNGDMDLWFGAYNEMRFSYGGVGGKMYCPGNGDTTCEATMTETGDYRAPFPVLATDYLNYDIGYYCMEMLNAVGVVVKADFLMIYGREQSLSAEKLDEVRKIVNEKVPDYSYDW